MHINFVTESKTQTWILRRWAEEWAKRINGSTITAHAVDHSADVNVFVNYALYQPSQTVSLCVFTHKEHDYRATEFEKIAKECDWCFAQSDYTMGLLPVNKSSKIAVGIGDHFYHSRPLKIGVVGRYYPTGRKRTHWIPELNKIDGVEVFFTDGNISYEDMPKFYDSCDWVLVTSELEGGSMVSPEALARYKPMILPYDVGWFNDYPSLKYRTYEELEAIIRSLVPNDKNNWELGANQIVGTAGNLLSTRDTFRYNGFI